LDGKAEGTRQRSELRRDAENDTCGDADDGVDQAGNDGKSHEKHFAF
jgi:hypothetical protein